MGDPVGGRVVAGDDVEEGTLVGRDDGATVGPAVGVVADTSSSQHGRSAPFAAGQHEPVRPRAAQAGCWPQFERVGDTDGERDGNIVGDAEGD